MDIIDFMKGGKRPDHRGSTHKPIGLSDKELKVVFCVPCMNKIYSNNN